MRAVTWHFSWNEDDDPVVIFEFPDEVFFDREEFLNSYWSTFVDCIHNGSVYCNLSFKDGE